MLKDKLRLCVPRGLARPLEGQKHGLQGREAKTNWGSSSWRDLPQDAISEFLVENFSMYNYRVWGCIGVGGLCEVPMLLFPLRLCGPLIPYPTISLLPPFIKMLPRRWQNQEARRVPGSTLMMCRASLSCFLGLRFVLVCISDTR